MDYERGLEALRRLAENTGWYQDFTLYEAPLRENLRDEQRYGPSEQTRRDRTRLVDRLNELALKHVGMSFNDLCLGKAPPAPQRPPGGSTAAQSAPVMSTATMRQLLSAAFDDAELTTLCFDHFRPVYENFATGMSKGQKIQQLLDYCERHDLLDQLLALVEQYNPAQYRKVTLCGR